MKNRRALPALLALAAVGTLCLGTALCLTSGMGLAAFGARPHLADAGAVAPATADETLADAPSADAGLDSGQPEGEATAHEVAPSADPEIADPEPPTAQAIALDREYRREVERHPDRNAYETLARRHRMELAEVLEVVASVGDYREAVATDARRGLGRGVVGRVEGHSVAPTDLGDMTLSLSLTVVGCPSGASPDSRLDSSRAPP
ncbi:MAG: hypothetical protein OHK0013_15130 [Sandaracinaceae bacterium]